MNLYTWTIGASHTPAAFVAIAGAALPFDLTDAVSTFLFALAFGPELARLLARTRARMNVRWEPAPARSLNSREPADGKIGLLGGWAPDGARERGRLSGH
jgi:hypothetical protein